MGKKEGAVLWAVVIVVATCSGKRASAQEDVLASEWRCYVPPGVAGLSIRYEVTKTLCPTQFAWVINVVDAILRSHKCTGVLISPREVLVPAHCVDGRAKGGHPFPLAIAGQYSWREGDRDGGTEMHRACAQIVHKNFTGSASDGGDIAILILNGEFKDYQTMDSFASSERCEQSTMVSIGWFSSRGTDAPSPDLQALPDITQINPEECMRALGSSPQCTICTAPLLGRFIAFDSGAPLLCDNGKLLGLASISAQNGHYSPTIHVDLSEYKEWIARRGKEEADIYTSNDDRCIGHTEL